MGTVNWHAYQSHSPRYGNQNFYFIDHKNGLFFSFFYSIPWAIFSTWFLNYDYQRWYFQARVKRFLRQRYASEPNLNNKLLPVFGATSYQIQVVSINKSTTTRAKKTDKRKSLKRKNERASERERKTHIENTLTVIDIALFALQIPYFEPVCSYLLQNVCAVINDLQTDMRTPTSKKTHNELLDVRNSTNTACSHSSWLCAFFTITSWSTN